MPLSIIILAGGKGTRMPASLPKCLQPLAGKPMLQHVVDVSTALNPSEICVVVGEEHQLIQQTIQTHVKLNYVPCKALGTGYVVKKALAFCNINNQVLILMGDVPCVSLDSLKQLIQETAVDELGLVVAQVKDPTGLGRIVRDKNNQLIKIIEEKDADANQKQIHEINAGIYLAPQQKLMQWLANMNNHNQQGEYYLTDIVPEAIKQGGKITTVMAIKEQEILGVNTFSQLAKLERYFQQNFAEELMLRKGVRIIDPQRFDCRGELTVGTDVIFDINVIIEGKVKIGNHCHIGPNCTLKNVEIGDHVTIKANSMLEGSNIGNECQVGPFARIRPGTTLLTGAYVGNFTEIKNSQLGQNSKSGHFSYLGDAIIGTDVNIGAGTITCNYDGNKKHQTIIHDQAFIGSGTELVAPVTIGKKAYIGAGSTITKNANEETLTLARSRQVEVKSWKPTN